MNNQEYQAKFTIKDIETKTDSNFNSYFLLHFANSNYQTGYAFKNTLNSETQTIENNPDKGITATIANYIPMATLLDKKTSSLNYYSKVVRP